MVALFRPHWCASIARATARGHRFFNTSRFSATASSENFLRTQTEKAVLQKGVLVAFQKESGNISIGVTQSREGKSNWSVIDQNAETCVIRPTQVKLVVPGTENFNPESLNQLLCNVELLQDPTLLELAWQQMNAKNKTVDLEELSLIIYGSMTPEKCYSTYRLLSSNPVYFKCKEWGFSPVYEPRPLAQVQELRLKQLQEALAHKDLSDFVADIKSAMSLPVMEKPRQCHWDSKEDFRTLLLSLKAFALQTCKSPEQKNDAMKVLKALGVNTTSEAAQTLMLQMGYFSLHENFDLLKTNLPLEFSPQSLAAATEIRNVHLHNLDKDQRVDLTCLKVFTIDTDNPDEVDDGLSAVQLPDGRLKVWIHVADATCWVDWNNCLRKEASQRCTSIYLPSKTIPMFPMALATGSMSFRQGCHCPAVSVSVILSHDGSVAESTVQNSIICPTYKLSYGTATELLSLNMQEETELSILYKAASLRNKWRLSNGALNVVMPKVDVSVEDETAVDPIISIAMEDDSSPAAVLVSEMMILCGEVISMFGIERGLSLPYRGQPHNEDIKKAMYAIPEGLARSFALVRCSSRVDVSFTKPLPHASLGLSGYVQFTSPIRRYVDLLTHYQIKAVLRGENPPLSSGYLEASMVTVNAVCKTVKKLQYDSDRYWILEYLRRQPADKKYRACILRFLKDKNVLIFLVEMGIQSTVSLRTYQRLGNEIFVRVQDAQPRKNILILREA